MAGRTRSSDPPAMDETEDELEQEEAEEADEPEEQPVDVRLELAGIPFN